MENLVSVMVSWWIPSMMQVCHIGSNWRRLDFTFLTSFCNSVSFQGHSKCLLATWEDSFFFSFVYSFFTYEVSSWMHGQATFSSHGGGEVWPCGWISPEAGEWKGCKPHPRQDLKTMGTLPAPQPLSHCMDLWGPYFAPADGGNLLGNSRAMWWKDPNSS